MEIEKDIKVVEELINSSKLARLYEGNKYYESMEKLIHYIKEESIPRALVEEVINKQIEIIRNKNEQLYYAENVTDVILEDILQEILNKGEK